MRVGLAGAHAGDLDPGARQQTDMDRPGRDDGQACGPAQLLLDERAVLAPVDECRRDQRAKQRKSRGPRAMDSRMTDLDASTTANLNAETLAKVTKANDAVVQRKLKEAHMNHAFSQKK
jgi:hypothetical protein